MVHTAQKFQLLDGQETEVLTKRQETSLEAAEDVKMLCKKNYVILETSIGSSTFSLSHFSLSLLCRELFLSLAGPVGASHQLFVECSHFHQTCCKTLKPAANAGSRLSPYFNNRHNNRVMRGGQWARRPRPPFNNVQVLQVSSGALKNSTEECRYMEQTVSFILYNTWRMKGGLTHEGSLRDD